MQMTTHIVIVPNWNTPRKQSVCCTPYPSKDNIMKPLKTTEEPIIEKGNA